MRYIVVFTIILFLINSSYGQVAFYRQYSENGSDFGQGIVQLEDDSYVVTGASSSYANNQSQAFLMKLNDQGDVLWSTNYGGLESDWGRRVLYKQGYGFYVCGFTNSYGNGAYDFYMVKTDESGVEEWSETYGDTGWEKVHDAALTRDTGVFMIGETNSTLNGDHDIYLVRTDKNGDTLWTKKLGGSGEDYGHSIVQKNDSVFIIGSTIYVTDSLQTKGYLVEIDEDGVVYWTDTIGTNGMYTLEDIWLDQDTIRCVGSHQFDLGVNLNNWRASYKVSTNTLFQNVVDNNTGNSRNRCIARSGEGVAYYVGYNFATDNTYEGGEDLTVGRYQYPLYFWVHQVTSVAHIGQDEPGDIIPTSDGGAVMTGYTSSEGLGGGNIFVLKIGPNVMYPDAVGVVTVTNFVGIEEVLSSKVNVSVYPNPTDNVLTIEVDFDEEIQIELIDLAGNLVKTEKMFGETNISVSELNTGMYTLRLTSKNQLLNVKRVIVK